MLWPDKLSAMGGLVIEGFPQLGQEAIGDFLRKTLPDHNLQPALKVEAAVARSATVEMRPDAVGRRFVHLFVEIFVETFQGFVTVVCAGVDAVVVRHGLSAFSGSSPRLLANSHNVFCIAFLPRCSLDITVPIGISRMSAIS
jgi:hypothetical protein